MTFVETVSGIVLISFLIVIFVSLFFENIARISPTPSLPWVRKRMMEALERHLETGQAHQFAELGCGWGGINVVLARKFVNSHVVGYEISPFPYFFSKFRALFASKRVKIINSSFFKADLSGFDALICYLSPWHMEELKPQLAHLRPGSLIISNAFAIPGWEPVEILHTDVGMKIPVYVYRVG